MRVAIVQFKSKIGKVAENVAMASRLVGSVGDADVIILPELWLTGYYPVPVGEFADRDGEYTAEIICDMARRNNVNVIGGSSIVEVGGQIFNRCVVSDRRGDIVAVYDKAHLFSYAGEGEVFCAGDKIVTVTLDGVKCGLAICYDLRFPEFIRKLALRGIEILFIPAAWSHRRVIPRRVLTRARAIENQVFVVFANSGGVSEVINPAGEIVVEGGVGEQILMADIDFSVRKGIIASMNLLADRNIFTDN